MGNLPVQQNLPQLDQLMGPPPCEGTDSLHLHAEISASPKILTKLVIRESPMTQSLFEPISHPIGEGAGLAHYAGYVVCLQ